MIRTWMLELSSLGWYVACISRISSSWFETIQPHLSYHGRQSWRSHTSHHVFQYQSIQLSPSSCSLFMHFGTTRQQDQTLKISHTRIHPPANFWNTFHKSKLCKKHSKLDIAIPEQQVDEIFWIMGTKLTAYSMLQNSQPLPPFHRLCKK